MVEEFKWMCKNRNCKMSGQANSAEERLRQQYGHYVASFHDRFHQCTIMEDLDTDGSFVIFGEWKRIYFNDDGNNYGYWLSRQSDWRHDERSDAYIVAPIEWQREFIPREFWKKCDVEEE
jgi:hypothetical protein